MIRLVTIVDEYYWRNKMVPWVDYVIRNNNFGQVSTHVIMLGFEVSIKEQDQFNALNFIYLDAAKVVCNNENNCVQHGEFLQCFPDALKDDVFIVVDGDALLQRALSPQEIAMLNSMESNTIAMNWNAGIGDTLFDEALRISPLKSVEEIKSRWCPDGWFNCHNAGVIAAKKSAWDTLYSQYCKHWKEIGLYFNHIARQQWLINWCAYTKPLQCEILPFTFHVQNHYKLPENTTVEVDGLTKYENQIVLFRHKIMWFPTGIK